MAWSLTNNIVFCFGSIQGPEVKSYEEALKEKDTFCPGEIRMIEKNC